MPTLMTAAIAKLLRDRMHPESPDGTRIAVIDFSDDYLFVVAADGSDKQILVRKNNDGRLAPGNPG